MNNGKIPVILLVLTIFMVVLGLKTLFPSAGASKPNLLSYKSTCTFAPVSTFILFWMAAVLYSVRARRLLSADAMKGNTVALIALSVLFLAGIAFYSYRYIVIRQATQVTRVTVEPDAAELGTPPGGRE